MDENTVTITKKTLDRLTGALRGMAEVYQDEVDPKFHNADQLDECGDALDQLEKELEK